MGLKTKTGNEIASYIGTGVKDLIRKSLGPADEALSDEALKIFSSYYVSHSHDNSVLYPNVKEILEYYRDKSKYILTNRYSRFADSTLTGLGIRNYFLGIIGGDDENCLKPSACVLDMALPGLKIDRSKSIIVGDMAIDIMTGKNSGVKTCWVTYGLGKAEEVRPIKPDYVIDDIAELKKIIE